MSNTVLEHICLSVCPSVCPSHIFRGLGGIFCCRTSPKQLGISKRHYTWWTQVVWGWVMYIFIDLSAIGTFYDRFTECVCLSVTCLSVGWEEIICHRIPQWWLVISKCPITWWIQIVWECFMYIFIDLSAIGTSLWPFYFSCY